MKRGVSRRLNGASGSSDAIVGPRRATTPLPAGILQRSETLDNEWASPPTPPTLADPYPVTRHQRLRRASGRCNDSRCGRMVVYSPSGESYCSATDVPTPLLAAHLSGRRNPDARGRFNPVVVA